MKYIPFIAIAIISLMTLACAGSRHEPSNASDLEGALEDALEHLEHNEALEARLEAIESGKAERERSATEIVERVYAEAKANGMFDPEEDVDATEQNGGTKEPPPKVPAVNPMRVQRRPAVNPRVCGMTGPSVGYLFQDMMQAKAAAKRQLGCNRSCQFMVNTTNSYMSIRVNRRAVTICQGNVPAEVVPTMRTAGTSKMVEAVSVAPPQSVVVIGKFVRMSPSFEIELHDQAAFGQPFIAHSKQRYSSVFPTGTLGRQQLVAATYR
ncbi:hypothetical protein GF380_00105 [Candidatus Uhrbacteria bacterium]|nr:hypothetical protein [Candidatus Uhrbacteria bacterium]MBD3283827.1 hypothetical protein [Candidatus Uhrbacteria bacterium]